MKNVSIKIDKAPIRDYIDAVTYKRKEATMADANEGSKDALTSDSSDIADGYLIEEFSDRWDAELRTRLKFCLVDDESEENEDFVFNNMDTYEDSYVYNLKVDDTFTRNDLKSVGKKIDTFIKRGTAYSWYEHAGIEPADNPQSLMMLADDIVFVLRGQPWGKRPAQPFGPLMNDFYGKR